MNEDETLWNENESARPEEIPAEDVLPEERPAEDGLPEGVPAEEPTVIGGSIPPMYGSPSFPEETRAEHVSEVEEPAEQPVAPPRDLPFKDFLKFFDLKQKKGIMWAAILCYFCGGLTVLVAVIGGAPLGAIDGLILIALALGMHILKNRVCAIAILVVALIEFFMALLMTGIPNGWLWVVAGVLSVYFMTKARKNYKTFQETGRLPD